MQASTHDFKPKALDIQAFARAGAQLQGSTPLTEMSRLAECAHGAPDEPASASPPLIHWQAQGELRERVGSPAQVWLHIQAQTTLPLTCQRCLQAVEQALSVDRSFRFVGSETEAAEEDADAEEDVLVLNRKFKLLELIEDELLLDLPVIARHEICPDPLPMPENAPEAVETSTEPAPNPFALLEALKKPRPGGH